MVNGQRVIAEMFRSGQAKTNFPASTAICLPIQQHLSIPGSSAEMPVYILRMKTIRRTDSTAPLDFRVILTKRYRPLRILLAARMEMHSLNIPV